MKCSSSSRPSNAANGFCRRTTGHLNDAVVAVLALEYIDAGVGGLFVARALQLLARRCVHKGPIALHSQAGLVLRDVDHIALARLLGMVDAMSAAHIA